MKSFDGQWIDKTFKTKAEAEEFLNKIIKDNTKQPRIMEYPKRGE